MTFNTNYTVPKMYREVSKKYPQYPAQYARIGRNDFKEVLFGDFYQKALDFAASLMNLGVKRGESVGLISDNRAEWLQADLGIMMLGAMDVPRGCDATLNDLEKIFTITESKYVICENNSQVNKFVTLKDTLSCISTIICLEDEIKESVLEEAKNKGINIYYFSRLMKEGKTWRIENSGIVEEEVEKGQWDDIATIIFTSGTTGTPKGVMLSHGNFLTQLDELPERIYLNPGERALSVLPVWHVYERLLEYAIMYQGASICYSKPIGSVILSDLKKLNPHLMPAVPRIFEALYDGILKKMRKAGGIGLIFFKFFVGVAKIQKAMSRKMFNQNPSFTRYYSVLWWFLFLIPWTLMWPLYFIGDILVYRNIRNMFGSNFRAGIVGGGAFPKFTDEFFWAIGIKVVEGYGLTETAPIVAVRPICLPIFRTIGSPIRGVEARIVDPTTREVLPRGKQGVLEVRGATVMKGYYKRPDLTAKAINKEGWFDTGDLAIMTIHNEIMIKGRIKDTIVLRGGENLEPVPIEGKLSESRYIKHAVVVGQDQRYLAALILVDEEELKNYAADNGIQYDTYENYLASEEVHNLYEAEIADLISAKNGFKIFERIARFTLITKPFEIGVELSAKQEVMRFKVNELYKKEIDAMFDAK